MTKIMTKNLQKLQRHFVPAPAGIVKCSLDAESKAGGSAILNTSNIVAVVAVTSYPSGAEYAN